MTYKKTLIIICVMLFFCGCTKYTKKVNMSVKNLEIKIEAINIENDLSISSIKNEIIGIVMFEEFGRPNKKHTNTVIGAHSGYGSNSYFNNINKLKENDKIYIYYENKQYLYLVKKVYEVNEIDTTPIEEKNDSILTLMTCKIGDSSRRIIVESTLILIV